MLQRIQTIYLLLAVLSIVMVFFVDIAHYTDVTGNHSELSLYRLTKANGDIDDVKYGMLPVALLAVTGALLFSTILQYRNRKVQMMIVRLCYVLNLLALVGIWYFVDQNYWSLELTEPDLGYRLGFYLPFVAFAFSWLANRSIRRDEELVRSLDRIR